MGGACHGRRLGKRACRSQNLGEASTNLWVDSRSVASGVPGPQVLPVLLVLAWGEEAIKPPTDVRDHFMHRMRTIPKHIDVVETWQSDDTGGLELKFTAPISDGYAGVDGIMGNTELPTEVKKWRSSLKA